MAFGRRALGAGCLDAAAASQARTLVAIGRHGRRPTQAELADLDADPARVGPADVDALTFRGVFRLLGGDLEEAIGDLSASVRLARRAATVAMGLRAYVYLALAQYLAGKWDDALLTAEQGFSAAAIQARHHRAAAAAPGGRMRAGQPRRGRGSRTARARWPSRPRPAWTTGKERCTRRWPGRWSARRPETTWAWPTRWARGRTTRPWMAAAGSAPCCGGRCWPRA